METLQKAADVLTARLAAFFMELQLNPARPSMQEYELLSQMRAEGFLALCEADNYWVALFRKHFLMRHCLYRVNATWAGQGQRLLLGPVSIELVVAAETNRENLPSEDLTYQALADYYGDLNHWLAATEETCRTFVDDFFKRFAAFNEAESHLTCLGLPKDAVWGVVQQRYRRLAQQHHPDKGGDAELFLTFTRAFEALKRLRGP